MAKEYRISKGYSVEGQHGYLRHQLPSEYKTYEFRKDCNARILMTNAFLKFHPDTDPEYARRPYLRLHGECIGVAAQTEDHLLPHDRAFIDLDDEDVIQVSMTYEFTDAQIADLVMKGLFHTGFQCPDAIKNAEEVFTLAFPAEITTFFPGEEAEKAGMVPLYFINLPKTDITISEENSNLALERAFVPMEGLDTNVVNTPEEDFVPLEAKKETEPALISEKQPEPKQLEEPQKPEQPEEVEEAEEDMIATAEVEKPNYYWDDSVEEDMKQEVFEKIAAATKTNPSIENLVHPKPLPEDGAELVSKLKSSGNSIPGKEKHPNTSVNTELPFEGPKASEKNAPKSGKTKNQNAPGNASKPSLNPNQSFYYGNDEEAENEDDKGAFLNDNDLELD